MHIYNTCERMYIFVHIHIESKLPGIICHLAEIQHTYKHLYMYTHTHTHTKYAHAYVAHSLPHTHTHTHIAASCHSVCLPCSRPHN